MKAAQQRTAEGILFTDQYQFTMAQLYFRRGLHEMPARFEHFFRKYPDYGNHQAGYCIFAGLAWLLDWMESVRVTDSDVEHLRSQTGRDGKPVFKDDFLEWLREEDCFRRMRLRAVPEGRVVHANEPLVVAEGPLGMAQILESSLLNHLNYQTLVATKASRIRESGRGRPLLDFGMRRAQGFGANAGARAALVGGADFSSNVGISHVLGFPPKGTHAHSLVQAFMATGEGELGAFRAYAEVYPDDCLLLVDTVDTLRSGIPNAIKVFEELRAKGHEPVGIRLDSGDLAHLTVRAARLLNDAGFPDVKIVLSNQLDELVILQIMAQIQSEASQYELEPDAVIGRLIYGVGTRLITSQGKAALDGVYKLVAIKTDAWKPAIKMAETPEKTITPGSKQVWRLYDERSRATADLVCRDDERPLDEDEIELHHPIHDEKHRRLRRENLSDGEPLLVDVFRDGKRVSTEPTIQEIRERRDADLERLHRGVRRIINPHVYHVSLSRELWELKQGLMRRYQRGGAEG